ncbi:helix-turn-helix domain-containing protein [Colwellia ponticola]|uniref:Helix-turn-helix domain-containing protein n=1 Tax=Colwellia ponticola TaxID=2304625 RepID=A0A8H2JKT0_9GAMM|nr:helix-turn-helix domain-containing protein [Colwellia ponticola]TMM44808.1 helix-turn-helix domain-containing protein [Colwellia ponticola]
MTKQHANATTTPEMREFIHASDLPTAVLARLLKISEATVRKWRKRASLADGSHVPKQLNTTLSIAQEYVVVELRTRLLLSLDELLTVCKQFINANVSRAGLQRCLKRHGVSRLVDIQAQLRNVELHNAELKNVAPKQAELKNNSDSTRVSFLSHSSAVTVQVLLEDTQAQRQLTSELSPQAMRAVLNQANEFTEDEVVQVNVTQLPHFAQSLHEKSNKYRLLIAHDPMSRWVYVDIYDSNESEAASRYMSYVLTQAPFHIRRILASNYHEFLSRFRLLNESPEQATTAFSLDNIDDFGR